MAKNKQKKNKNKHRVKNTLQEYKTSFMHRRTPPGAIPGTLIADPDSPRPEFELLGYNANTFLENADASLEEILILPPEDQITWINIEGLGDVDAVQAIGRFFDLHPLALEDVVNVHQRPKLENYKNVLFLVARMPHPEVTTSTEQVAFFLGEHFLLTFQEGTPGDAFEPVRRRLRENSGRLRSSGPGYLLYALMDALIDQYFPLVEFYANMLENIEDRLIDKEQTSFTSEIYTIRRNLMQMHRSIRPLQDVIGALMRENTPLFDEDTQIHLRDCLDHTAQLLDMLDNNKDLATHLMEMAEAAAGHRLNEIMRFLTVMSSIFIPLTFIAGIYGMNFNTEQSPWNMPELNFYLGYPLSILMMLATVFGLLLFFRHKGWLGIPGSEQK